MWRCWSYLGVFYNGDPVLCHEGGEAGGGASRGDVGEIGFIGEGGDDLVAALGEGVERSAGATRSKQISDCFSFGSGSAPFSTP